MKTIAIPHSNGRQTTITIHDEPATEDAYITLVASWLDWGTTDQLRTEGQLIGYVKRHAKRNPYNDKFHIVPWQGHCALYIG